MAQSSNRESVKVFITCASSNSDSTSSTYTDLPEEGLVYETWAARITSHLRSLATALLDGAGEGLNHPTTGRCADLGLFISYAGTRVPDVFPLEHVGKWKMMVL